jgi:hypothetical protein
MNKTMGIVGAIVVVVLLAVGYWFYSLQQAAVQWDHAKEIYSESIENDGAVWKVKMQSLIEKPVDQVWRAATQPERSSEFIDSFKKSELKSKEGNKKVVEMHIQVLTLPVQAAVLEFSFDDASKTTHIKTIQSAAQDLTATYSLAPSPDGKKTLFTYDAIAKMKISVPLPISAQRGAFKELFVKTVRAIQKGIEDEESKKAKGAA